MRRKGEDAQGESRAEREHMEKDMMSTKARIVGLDMFRIFLVVLVLAFHSNIHFQCSYGILDNFVSMGAIAMTGFFMLSGFSLYYMHESEDILVFNNVKRFYKKRLTGIIPSYYMIGLLYCVFCGPESVLQNLLLAPMEAMGIQAAYPSTFGLTHNGGTWFISCLLMCYLLFPFMKGCIGQMEAKSRLILLALLGGVMLYSPIVVWRFQLGSIYSNPFFRIIEFLIGVLLASHRKEIDRIGWLKGILFNRALIVAETAVMVLGVSLAYGLDIARGNYMLYSWICLPLFSAMLVGLSGGGKEEMGAGKQDFSVSEQYMLCIFPGTAFHMACHEKTNRDYGHS